MYYFLYVYRERENLHYANYLVFCSSSRVQQWSLLKTSLQQGSSIGNLVCLQSASWIAHYLQLSVTCSTWPVLVRQHCSILGWECLQPSTESDKCLQGQGKPCSGRFWFCKLFHLALIVCAFEVCMSMGDGITNGVNPGPLQVQISVITLCFSSFIQGQMSSLSSQTVLCDFFSK